MKTLFRVLVSGAICCLLMTNYQASGKDMKVKIIPSDPDGIIKPIEKTVNLDEKSATGGSPNNPIILGKIKNVHELKLKQENYIRKHYEGYRVNGDSLTVNKKGRIIQGFMLKNDDGVYKHIYFDADDALRKYNRLKDKGLADMVKEILKDAKENKGKTNNPYKVPEGVIVKP